MSTTTAVAEDMLERLGPYPDDIAGTLLAEDCRGERGSSGHCPVASYLLDHLGSRVITVAVGPTTVALLVRDDTVEEYETVWLPGAVAEFITAFDLGRYDELATDAGLTLILGDGSDL